MLPGVDGEQLQGILGGQRPLFLQFLFTLKEKGECQTIVVKAGRRELLSESPRNFTLRTTGATAGYPSPETQCRWDWATEQLTGSPRRFLCCDLTA